MSVPPAAESPADFGDRFRRLGHTIGEREAAHANDLIAARAYAEQLRARVAKALEDFESAAREAGAEHVVFDVSEVRLDEKHVRAVEFELMRGRHRAVVVAKSRGEVTLVGPFRQGKAEGPCASFPFDAGSALHEALGDFLEKFCEEAVTP